MTASRPRTLTERVRDRGDGVPVARREWNAEDAVQPPEIVDGLHPAPVDADDETPLPREDPEHPGAAGGKAHRYRWNGDGPPGEDAHEADDVFALGIAGEVV